VWQRGGKAGAAASRGDGRYGDTLTKDFLRKYIHHAKCRIHPVLSDTAMEVSDYELAMKQCLEGSLRNSVLK
jgi:DNA replicative helicase MCM subunit Mcm2 (Cdc46/Mcm family)